MTDITVRPTEPALLNDVEMTPTSWRPTSTMTFEEWETAGHQLQLMARACQWWVGDWVNYGDQCFGERYAQAIELTGLEYSTIANAAYVARSVDISRRREDLSWSHHAEVASLAADEQTTWLERAERDGLTREKLRAQLRKVLHPPEPGDQTTQGFKTTIEIAHQARDLDAALRQQQDYAAALHKLGATVLDKYTDAHTTATSA